MKFTVGDKVTKINKHEPGTVLKSGPYNDGPYLVDFPKCQSWFISDELKLYDDSQTEAAILNFVPVMCPWCASRIEIDNSEFLKGDIYSCNCGLKYKYNKDTPRLEARIYKALQVAITQELTNNPVQDIIDILNGKGE